jgi:hypothetical protein
LDLALSFDGSNIRAQLYKKLNAPVIALKGSIKRLEPVVAKFSPPVQQAYDQQKQLTRVNPSIDAFFNSGKADIQTEGQAQALIEQVLVAQNDLRVFLKGHLDISIQLNPMTPDGGEIADIWQACPVVATDGVGKYHKKYTTKTCPFLHPTDFTMDAGDIEAVQQMVAGMQILTIAATAYDATGGGQFESAVYNNPDMSVRQRIGLLQNLKQLGKVRNAATFKMIQSLGADIMAGARWAEKYQAQLCPHGPGQEQQRPGKLFDQGICVQDYPGQKPGTLDKTFGVVEMALAGQNVAVFTRDGGINVSELADSTDGAAYSTQANLLAPIVNPIADLKQILPTKFDKCGNTTNLGDKTVAGLFPSRDGEDVAKSTGVISEPCQ